MVEGVISWLQSHLLPCTFKQCFGVDCPTCGMQRAFIELLKGNLTTSLSYHWALIPTLTLFTFLLLHLKFGFSRGTLVLKVLFGVNVGVIILNYIFN